MTVVCLTDAIAEQQLRKLGAFGPLLVRAIAGQLREERVRRSSALDEAQATIEVDFRPCARPRFELRLGYAGVEAIRRELGWGALEGVETGGYLWAFQRSARPGRRGRACLAAR